MDGKDPAVVEACANNVVDCIRQVIDVLRSAFPPTNNTIKPNSKQSPLPPLYTQMVEKKVLHQVQVTITKQKTILGREERRTLQSSNLDDERYRLVHDILLPLIQSLFECYTTLDRFPQPQQPIQTKPRSRRAKKPLPPVGMLSLQNYTDVACLLEFTICTSILPHLEPFVLIALEDRLRYHLPKSLAGRIPRPSLAWASQQPLLVMGSDTSKEELIQTASVISNLLLLDRFRPMLLPRHLSDIYAAFFQAEQLMDGNEDRQQLQNSKLYIQLGLNSTRKLDATLQAKTYQTLLLQGTKGPPWMRQRVSPLLTQLACTNLVAIVQVFVPLQEPSMPSQRLGRALASSSPQQTKALCRQMGGLLEFSYPSNGEIPASTMAILQTMWAVIQNWPANIVQKELFTCWEQGLLDGTNPKQSPTDVHSTIRRIGALCSFVPPSVDPLSVLQYLFRPHTTIFDQLVRVASMPSVLESTARQDARQTLQWLSKAIYGTKSTDRSGKIGIRGSDLLVAAWVHALTPSTWDLAGNTYCMVSSEVVASSDKKPSSRHPLEKLSVRKKDAAILGIGFVADIITKRADIFMETVVQSCFKSDGQEIHEDESAQKMRGLPSILFRLLLRLYLSRTLNTAAAENFGDRYRLVSIVLLPMLCERCPPEGLLFDDETDAIGLLRLVKLVLLAAMARLESQTETINSMQKKKPIDSSVSNDESAMINYLVQLGNNSTSEDRNKETLSLISDNEQQDDTLLSIASIVLSLLIAVLELGSKLRSLEEEELLKSFLPILQTLAEFTHFHTGSSQLTPQSQDSDAGMADMAGYAMALIASRQAPEKGQTKNDISSPITPMDKLKRSVLQAEEDLQSTQPPIRARGMVSLGRLARGFTGIIPKEKIPLVTEFEESSESEEDPTPFLIQEVLRLSMAALSDSESYVYLAAVQTVVAMGDMKPKDVLPIIASTFVTGVLEPGANATPFSKIKLSNEQRIKLAEALMFIIRRRAAPDEFVQATVNLMVFGSAERIGTQADSNKPSGQTGLIQEETHNYFLRVDCKEESEQETQEEKWEEQDIRLKTGGPLFSMEEIDVVRSARVLVLAELISASRPSSVAKHCRLLVRLVIDVLRLDSSRVVTRAAALLARELYGSLLREQYEMAEVADRLRNETPSPLSFGVALVASEEELLVSALQRYALSASQAGEQYGDPATTVRCAEALNLREQADESGIIAAAQLLLSQAELNPVPRILTSFPPDQSGIIEIDRMNFLG